MRRFLVYIVCLLTWSAIVAGIFLAEEKYSRPPVQRNDITSLKNYLVEELNEAVTKKELGCATLAILHNGRPFHEQGFGIVDPATTKNADPQQTMFLLSSLSKAVTAWGVLKLVQDGKLALDEPILPRLKRWRFPGSERYSHKVTARHLLSHTAGFFDGYGHSGVPLREKLQTIEESLILPAGVNSGTPRPALLVNEPGTVMSYSTAGYGVLQLLIEEISGQPFEEYMQRSVFEPLGMNWSFFSMDSVVAKGRVNDLAPNYDLGMEPHPHHKYANMAGVSLRTTAHDLVQLAKAYCDSNSVLQKNLVKEFSRPQPGTGDSWGLGHTLYGTDANGHYITGHGGGAFPASGSEMRINPATGNGIILLASGTRGLISRLGDTWTYWETGTKPFDVRNIIQKRLWLMIVLVCVGAIGIILLLRRRRLTYRKR